MKESCDLGSPVTCCTHSWDEEERIAINDTSRAHNNKTRGKTISFDKALMCNLDISINLPFLFSFHSLSKRSVLTHTAR